MLSLPLPMLPVCSLQEATSEASRQIIGEEVVSFLKSGGGAEVRRGCGATAGRMAPHTPGRHPVACQPSRRTR
jgi:hypothetical protein